MKRYKFLILLNILLTGQLFSSTVTITPSGSDNDSGIIQTALDIVQNGDTLILQGDFTFKNTLYLPSDFTWILSGSLTLSADAELDKVGWVTSEIDARRRTAITEKNGGATNINMSGGIYYGNSANYSKSVRFINFVRVTYSKFRDMHITEVTDDNFTLGPGCNNNECRNLLCDYSLTGNALTDKGDHNTWYDCTAANCLGPDGDGWTPKCRYSTFIRCIAANNMGPGFGMYAREEGYANNKDVGAHIIGNKFIDCVSYGSGRGSGFSFNISSNCPEAIIKDNFIQAVCYNNHGSGVYFRNKDDAELGVIKDNEVDIVCFGNKCLSKSGNNNSWAGGLGMENDNSATHNLIENISGFVVCYNNRVDVSTKGGDSCTITVYHPAGEKTPLWVKGGRNNTVNIIDYFCSDTLNEWCQEKFCAGISQNLPAAPENLVTKTISSSEIKLSWSDSSIDEAGFKIERKTTDVFTEIATVEANGITYTNQNLNASTTYSYRIRAFNNMGYSDYSNEDSTLTDNIVGLNILVPTELNTEICKSYPNPFTQKTTISYVLSKATEINIKIYNIQGKQIQTLLTKKRQLPGKYNILWHAIDENGNSLPNGIYIYRIEGLNENGLFVINQKLMLMNSS